jgi:hypothetical protein
MWREPNRLVVIKLPQFAFAGFASGGGISDMQHHTINNCWIESCESTDAASFLRHSVTVNRTRAQPPCPISGDLAMAMSEPKLDAGFHTVLASSGRSPEIPAAADAYGWLVGDWELDVLHYWGRDVAARRIKGEVHAGWVLEGRAVQDVWIMPRRAERTLPLDKQLNMYGTTLRVFDPALAAWRITWSNPAGNHYEEQVGRKSGDDIVQIGKRPDGTSTRWSFTEITPDSFHWLGEALYPNANTWTLEGEFRAKRTR